MLEACLLLRLIMYHSFPYSWGMGVLDSYSKLLSPCRWQGLEKIHLFAFLFSNIIIRTVECFTHCHGNPHTTVYQETYSGTKESNWWESMEPTSFMQPIIKLQVSSCKRLSCLKDMLTWFSEPVISTVRMSSYSILNKLAL